MDHSRACNSKSATYPLDRDVHVIVVHLATDGDTLLTLLYYQHMIATWIDEHYHEI
jgi:hypothetical protein